MSGWAELCPTCHLNILRQLARPSGFLGTHRVVNWSAITASNIKPGSRFLDIAARTGDLTILISRRVGPQGSVILGDFNARMPGTAG